jgi:DNA-binding transcriptional LysR family regulator
VASGLGVSIVPQILTRVHVDGVSFRPIEGDALHARVSLVHRRNDQSAAVKNLVALVRRMVGSGAQFKEIAHNANP